MRRESESQASYFLPIGLSLIHTVKVGWDKRRDAENAEGRRDFLILRPSPNHIVGQLFFSSALLWVLCASAFIRSLSTARIRLSTAGVPPNAQADG